MIFVSQRGLPVLVLSILSISLLLIKITQSAFELPSFNYSSSDPSRTQKGFVGHRNSTELSAEVREDVVQLSAAIFNIDTDADTSTETLECTRDLPLRYEYLRKPTTSYSRFHATGPKIKYFFALDLYEIAPILPRLLGSIIRTIEYLGPEHCTLSIVEGNSVDGTYEILSGIAPKLEALNISYYFNTSNIHPEKKSQNRIAALAELRNEALRPLTSNPEQYSADASIIFLNDITLCPEDILELIHQRNFQDADMTCAMDWIYGGNLFYDTFVSRGITGDTFFEIPQNGSWDFAESLFWADPKTLLRFENLKPFQVFSCWNGVSVFTAKPLLQHGVAFRNSGVRFQPAGDAECYIGEPTNLAKDFWRLGFGKIMVVPSVNVGYNKETRSVKERRGWTIDNIAKAAAVENVAEEINWSLKPPAQVKCFAHGYTEPYWVDPITGHMI